MNFSIERFYFSSIIIQIFITCLYYSSCAILILVLNRNDLYKPYSRYLELSFFCFYLFDYIMELLATKRAIKKYLLSFDPILSVLAVISVFTFIYPPMIIYVGYLRFPTILKILRVLRLIRAESSFIRLLRLVLMVLSFFLVASGVVHALNFYNDNAFKYSNSEKITYFDSLYFVVVTVATVGYGDIVPYSTLAKIVVIMTILLGFGFLPTIINELVDVFLKFRMNKGRHLEFNLGTKYILLCGIVDYELLNHFLSELYANKPNSPEFEELCVVVLSPLNATEKVNKLISCVEFEEKVVYIKGSAKNPDDLKRIRLENFSAIYLIGDIVTKSLRVEEDSIFLSAISMTKFIGIHKNSNSNCQETQSPVILVKMSHTGRGKKLLQTHGITVLSLQEFKYSLIGLGTAVPGTIAIFSNLCKATPPIEINNLSDSCSNTNSLMEYFKGVNYSLREFKVDDINWSNGYLNSTFKEALKFMYIASKGKVILIATTKMNSNSPPSIDIQINPDSNLTIHNYQSIFALCDSYEVVVEILQSDLVYDCEFFNANDLIFPSDTMSNVSSSISEHKSHLNRNKYSFDKDLINIGNFKAAPEPPEIISVKERMQSFLRSVVEEPVRKRIVNRGKLNTPYISGLCSFGLSVNKDGGSADELIEFDGHIIIILESPENKSINSLILCIVYCLRSIRKYFTG